MSESSLTPPRGDSEKAEKYVNQLVDLISQNKIEVFQTDLKKFEPTTLKNHYSVSLKDYQIEISHSRNPDSEKDSHVMIFNNLKNLAEGTGDKVILAYVYLVDSQFAKFKLVADRQIYVREKALEERKFKQAVEPIDKMLDQAQEKAAEKPAESEDYSYDAQTVEKLDDYSSSQIHQI